MISIVIPARDEERELPGVLRSVNDAFTRVAVGDEWEVVVVDDASSDRTAEIATAAGAKVVSVELHNIAAVRNAGAAAARGGRLIFLDADTHLPAATLRATLDAFDAGAVGGGAGIAWDETPSWFSRACATGLVFIWQRVFGWAAGCYVFARRDAFEAVGGFDVTYFAAEERFLSAALKRHGRAEGRPFTVLHAAVVTSARKMRLYTPKQLVWIALPALLGGQSRLRQRAGLEILYDAPRESQSAAQAETAR